MRKIAAAASLLLLTAAPMQGQVSRDTDKTPKERLNDFLDETGQGMKKAGETIAGFLGIESKTETDVVTVEGVKYMPLYTANLFQDGGNDLLERCKADFRGRYPQATIVSAAIPQKDWTSVAVKEYKKIVSYKRTLYCYVLAKDGVDGYINVRYAYRLNRLPGKEWPKVETCRPAFERADAIPNTHYEQLLKR